jgi:zinc protease
MSPIDTMLATRRRRALALLVAVAALAAAGCSKPGAKGADQRDKQDSGRDAAKTARADAGRTGGGDLALPEIEVSYEKFVLDNGLTVVVHEDHSVPVVAVNVWYHVGSKDEERGRTGFAHLFEHLMFQGSENFVGEFFEPLEKAGATDMNGTTNRDRTNYFQTVPTSAIDLALWMESDRMGHFAGAISQERLDEQRGVVKNEKRQGLNRPYGKAWELIAPNTFPHEHPYSWPVIGSMEDLDAASLADVREWFDTYYGASNAVLVLAGDITPEQARSKAERYFGHIEAGPAVEKRGPWIAKLEERKTLTTYDQVPQQRAYYVYNLPPYGREITERLRLVARILGEGKNSRLHERLVYRDQLATKVRVWFGDGEISTQLSIIADARPGVDLAKVEAALDEEIARLIEEGPKPGELDRVRMAYFSDLVTELEKVGGFGGKANLLAQNETYLGDPGAYERLLQVHRDATPESVREAAAQWMGGGVFVLRILPDPNYEAPREASAAPRDRLPEIGETPSLDLPDLQRAELGNGMEVVLAERHDAPVVRMRLFARGGYATDPDGKEGAAQLAMDVLDEGTEERGALELAAELERLGAELSSGAGLDYSRVSLEVPSTTMEPALDVFADVVRNPSFADDEIERQRKQLLAKIEQERARPFSTALRELGPLVFGEAHPYGIPLTGSGSKETVEGLSRDDLAGHHERVFRPGGATLVVVGDTTMEELRPALEARFGAWKGKREGDGAVEGAPKVEKVRIYLVDKPGAEQSLIVTGHAIAPRDENDHIAVEVMNAVIGGTFTSRLNMNLREEKHWSYGARSFVYETHGPQLFATYANVQTDKTSASMREIMSELRGFVGAAPITEAELTKIQLKRARALPGQHETTGELLGSVGEIVTYGLPDDYYDTYAERLRALTREQVQEAARRHIRLDEMTWIVIGDLSRIEEPVRALGFGEVEVIEK